MTERSRLRSAFRLQQPLISEVAELEDLPVGAVIAMIGEFPDAPAVACKCPTGWQFVGQDPRRYWHSSDLAPVKEPLTVLHDPRWYVTPKPRTKSSKETR